MQVKCLGFLAAWRRGCLAGAALLLLWHGQKGKEACTQDKADSCPPFSPGPQ
jgi:hypothetical protein